MILGQLVLAIGTAAALGWLRRREPSLRQSPRFDLALRAALVLWTLAAVVILSYGIPAMAHMSVPWDAVGKVIGFATLVVWPVALAPRRLAPVFAGLAVAALSVQGFFDLVYARHFGNLMPVTAFLGANQAWDIRESIGSLMRWQDLWLLVSFAAGIAVAMVVPRIAGAAMAPLPRDRTLRLAATAVLLTIGLSLFWHNLNHERARRVLSHNRMMKSMGLVGTHVVDTGRIIREAWQQGHPDPEVVRRVEEYLAQQAATRPVPGEGSPFFGVARGASVLVLQVESLQGFVIGLKVGGREVTPFLNRLTNEAAYFPAVIDQTGESNTADTEYLVNNSQHPMRQGAVVFRRPDNHFVTVPQLARTAGMATLSAHPWERGFWNRAIIHPRYGFDRSLFRDELGGIIDKVGWGSSDRAFYERVTPELAALPRPFFAYLITLMSHHPYVFYPDSRKELALGALEGSMLGGYLHLMHEVDASLERFLAELGARGVLDRALVVIFGDHDARMQVLEAQVATAATELGLSEETIVQIGSRDPRVDFVPLFVRLPGKELTGRVPTAGGQSDIGPTIAYLLGLRQPEVFIGRPLLPGAEGFAARLDGSVLTNNRLYLAQGVEVPAGGACVSFPALAPLPLTDCQGLARAGVDQLEASWLITDIDLVPHLSAKPAAAPSEPTSSAR
jgi:phosphoglycerol transferase MdoB-like AlkP superfamily enzyme